MYWYIALAVIVLGAYLALRWSGIRAGVSRSPSGKPRFWIAKGL